ncbi:MULTISPECIES: hypothetical protein [Rhodococcus]|uniref:hypothetical protein n=1 Tax=Rhodococcus TaxID=1827 RepID=UPI00295424F1|nr:MULTISPECIES: hypothetical protein [Rhodococcus]MDV7244471.1 hypothetical protein [Rhodococcus oxybenzonivorans]MDV7274286.1 hypothetical protein [Rhodococcus oxybenzonivorans]MDV7337828.1 hypothetical protein [Rhodococcus oxybenzonivorans]MDV7345236.1 hypothetical protein [Rhodococcus oxybenzonivorans]MDV8028924.1 hypothetical protein [Rhodococcus sp. IEGM 27]
MAESVNFSFTELPGVTFIATRGADGTGEQFVTIETTTEGGAPVEIAGFLGPIEEAG